MKLAAIYNVWDGEELLLGSMRSVAIEVDLFIIIYQNKSNYGEEHHPLKDIKFPHHYDITSKFYNPSRNNGSHNEKAKRNIGLDIAKVHGCTHFLHMDCDEYYLDFSKAVREYIDSKCDGSVAPMYTYFKKPTLRFQNHDNYFVPFIHKLHPHTRAGESSYPFRVDPTRRINCSDVHQIQEPMHHFSYVRKDIERKTRNSSARNNIEKSDLLRDYYDENTKAGSYIEDFRQTLIEVEDLFGIGDALK